MCGIFGYIGSQDAMQITLAGIKKLEYRGYDSSGIVGINQENFVECKELGKIQALTNKLNEKKLFSSIAMAHTRWATHGRPSVLNAHPHQDHTNSIAIVHNGIIENFDGLKEDLKEKGVNCISDTDSEVIAQLIGLHYNGDLLEAVQKVIPLLQGSFAITVMHKDYPDLMIAAALESPLAVGIGENEVFVSSDTNAFLCHTKEAIFLEQAEVAVITKDSVKIFDANMSQVLKKKEILEHQVEDASKGNFEHFTLKEIFEQPQTIRNALLSRYLEEYGTAIFEELNFDVSELLAVKKILILACGTSWNAGYVASYMLEDKARIPTQVEISSEFRYKNPIVSKDTLVIAISQSGETADTVAAMRELKEKGAKILAVCNVQGSTLAREADGCLFLRAGPEIGVCSTKAFTSQLTVLSLFTLQMARMRHMGKVEGQAFLQELKALPDLLNKVLKQAPNIEQIAKKYAKYDNFFFIGRNYMYPTSMEGALKLKEISYINANAYPAGEMKHGPIALISEECPTIALCANKMTADKLLSNLMEIKARSGPVLAIVEEEMKEFNGVADDVIVVPETRDELAAILTTVVTQLIAYYVAKERGTDIDQPRNLAKSVTVE